MLVQKTKLKTSTEKISDVHSIQEQASTSSNKELPYDGCSKKEQSNNTTSAEHNGDKNCQAEKCDMWPMKHKMDMWSNGPAMLIQHKMSKKQIVPQEDDKNCQSAKYYEPNKDQVKSMCSDKKCKENINMQPVKPQMDMQFKKPAPLMQSTFKEKHVPLYKDKNCQATIFVYDDSKSQSTMKMCSDKNCQEIINMQSVTNTNDMQLSKPTRLCNDKNC